MRCPDCHQPWNVDAEDACPSCNLTLEALDDAETFLQLNAEDDAERQAVEL